MQLKFYSYRFADAVLNDPSLKPLREEIIGILTRLPVSLINPEGERIKHRSRGRVFPLPVNQIAMNVALDNAFREAGWLSQPPVVDPTRGGGPETGLKADFKKGRVQVEVQFGNMARWYTDVFKFQLSYSLDRIDAGVLVVPTQAFANLIDENIACFERVARELPWAKMSLTLPILVIGVQPDSFDPIRACYDRALDVICSRLKRQGHSGVPVPFVERIREQPQAEDEEANE